MKLEDIVSKLHQLDENMTICGLPPWALHSDYVLTELDQQFRVPSEVLAAGFKYFLEIHVALEVLESLSGRDADVKDKAQLLIFYAENDAYPDWIYGTPESKI